MGFDVGFDPAGLTYNDAGLIPVIAQDATSLEVLMLAWMNAEAVARTLESGRVTYWSRSRAAFWIKGETSGHTQQLVDLRYDCDHTGRRTCFYTSVQGGVETELMQPE